MHSQPITTTRDLAETFRDGGRTSWSRGHQHKLSTNPMATPLVSLPTSQKLDTCRTIWCAEDNNWTWLNQEQQEWANMCHD
jgi:hypothetical protein